MNITELTIHQLRKQFRRGYRNAAAESELQRRLSDGKRWLSEHQPQRLPAGWREVSKRLFRERITRFQALAAAAGGE